MKIAFLILCHKNSEQINMLTKQLQRVNCDIYIHIDKKSDIRNNIYLYDNVYILPEDSSFSIEWGSNDMVKATLELIKYSKNSQVKYDYISLLSGQDFPLASLNTVNQFLEKPYNYIEVIYENDKRYNRYLKLYEIPYPSWISKDITIYKIIKRLYMLLTGGFRHTFSIFKRRKPCVNKFYFGSQWWILTSEAAYYCLDFSLSNPNYLDYFDKCIIPDECYFQTIIMNSKYSSYIRQPLTYVNWGKNRRSPETLITSDYEKLKMLSETNLFARKFDINYDSDIISLLEKDLRINS